MNRHLFPAIGLVLTALAAQAAATDLKPAIALVKQVGAEGRGNADAARAWQSLAKADAASLPMLLAAMDEANDLAVNWLRAAVDAIADREKQAGARLPLPALREFLADTRHHPRARRLAFELIARDEPAAAARLVPTFADDPSVELRHDAVQRLLGAADTALAANDKTAAAAGFRSALTSARDEAQIKKAAAALRKLGLEVDLPRHFGFLMEWQIIGPFDNTQLAGFNAVYPPEKEINLAAEYAGKLGKLRWSAHATRDDYGMVDFNKPLGDHKGVTAYAYTEFNAADARPAELRLGCKNGWKVWFNGQLLFGRDEYHRGSRLDQYRLPVQLQAGKNTLLVKACQNEEVKDWTKEWQFQLRVCDAAGTAILAKDRATAPAKAATKPTAQK
jgi:hypothetical protein